MYSSKARGACGRALSAPHNPQKIVSLGGDGVRTLPPLFFPDPPAKGVTLSPTFSTRLIFR